MPRLVDALPNGPKHHPTVQVFQAGGVPEVMLHLRRLGLLKLDALTTSGMRLDEVLDYLDGNRRQLAEMLGELMPEVKYVMPEGTYLAWLDFVRAHSTAAAG